MIHHQGLLMDNHQLMDQDQDIKAHHQAILQEAIQDINHISLNMLKVENENPEIYF
jgi:hypothetical protein